MKTSEAFPDDSWLETQFTCFDEDKLDRTSDSRWDTYIGNVHQESHGPQQSMWAWSMTATLPGLGLPFPRNGREATRKEASRRVVECNERMLRLGGVAFPLPRFPIRFLKADIKTAKPRRLLTYCLPKPIGAAQLYELSH
ncbi:hypothetical protein DC522_07840 [Microvirga sp. KLBC 81]|nr:hypothetical protein DC522_07840 [Microvirga sp. KLBC 81]